VRVDCFICTSIGSEEFNCCSRERQVLASLRRQTPLVARNAIVARYTYDLLLSIENDLRGEGLARTAPGLMAAA